MGTVKSTAPCQRFFSRLRLLVASPARGFACSWLRPTAEDVSAFGQHRKFPPHARKISGTQGSKELVIKANLVALRHILSKRKNRGATPIYERGRDARRKC